jgi:hypothetical protein
MRVNEVLHYIWDPIGVRGEPRARDEYDSYAPEVYSLLQSGAPSNRLQPTSTRLRPKEWG